MLLRPLFGAAVLFLLALTSARGDAPAGEKIFMERCAICHQANGQGAPPIYPPLAKSDWLKANREEAVKTVCEGRSGPLTVNGQGYNNTMPAQMLDDAQVASVLNFVFASWENSGAPLEPAEVAKLRQKTKFPTYALLQKAGAYAPVPAPPAGWTLSEAAQLPQFCTRFAGHPGRIYVLAQYGDIYVLDLANHALSLIIPSASYLHPERGDLSTSGITEGPDGRLWIVSNQQLKQTVPYQNEIVIYRTSVEGGMPGQPEPWLKTHYPYGIGSFNHGVSHMAFGPDGMLYVSSGSRTDGGEPGNDSNYDKGGEVDLTSCLWRLDPKAEKPKIEVIARGLRNAYGFAWDAEGRLFSVSNGPDASAPEEMDLIEPGKHYGFPYQFSNWPVEAGKPYPYTPVPPAGLEFTLPVVNLGPDGGGTAQGLSTFEPHSSPCGVIWCGPSFPEPLTNKFLMARFGNLLGPPAAPVDVGFDVLALQMEPAAKGAGALHATKILGPLGRPVDVTLGPDGSVLIMEYTRPLNFHDQLGWLPGRILQLAPARK